MCDRNKKPRKRDRHNYADGQGIKTTNINEISPQLTASVEVGAKYNIGINWGISILAKTKDKAPREPLKRLPGNT